MDSLLNMVQNNGIELNTNTLNYLDMSLLTGNADDVSYYFEYNGDDDQQQQQQQYNYTYSKLSTSDGQLLGGDDGLSLLIRCNKCASMCGDDYYNYTAPNADNGDIDEATISEWAAQLGECIQTGDYFDNDGNFALYAGWMCNSDHTMIEPMLFLDQQCTVYDFKTTYEQFVDGTDDSAILASSEAYVKGLFYKNYPLYQTPTPLSWADIFENGANVQSLGLEDVEQQYYEAMANGGNGNNNNNNGDDDNETFEEMWLEALAENMQADEDLANVFQDAIDLETCAGTNGQYFYQDENGNQYMYNASSSLYLQNDNGDGDGDAEEENAVDLYGPCTIFYKLAGDYSTVTLGPGNNYYSPVNQGKMVWVENMKITKAGKIALVVLVSFIGLCIMSIVIGRTCFRNKAVLRRKKDPKLDGTDNSKDGKKTPLIMEYEPNPNATPA